MSRLVGLALVAGCLATSGTAVRGEAPQGGEGGAASLSPAVLTSARLDELIARELETPFEEPGFVSDARFLRRVSLDLIGRQPTPHEIDEFERDSANVRRQRAIDRLLASPEFGSNWANYWSDTIAWRVPPPELTFLDYRPLEGWLAGQLNGNASWDQIVQELLTGTGKVKEQPAATFVAYHQGSPTKLAAETARIFLSVQIQCAECHDHPFDDWKREQFHQLAAFFARTAVKMPWNEGPETVVSDKGKGEYLMPDAVDPTRKGQTMQPVFFTGTAAAESGLSDLERRLKLAAFITSPENPWFARSYVNRVWARLMGRGFYEPVDDMGLIVAPVLPEVHERLADHFAATGCDVKDLFRLIVRTDAYRRGLPGDIELADKPLAAARAARLRGDEVFDSLATAVALPDLQPPTPKPTAEIRFPIPPKSTREMIAETFGYDPSLNPRDVMRNMNQAMLLMNNEQLQAQVNADPASGTVLARLLASDADDERAFRRLFEIMLAREPTDREVQIALEHIGSVERRGAAFEDLLWALMNATEFTTKR
jgi:Protein of unknown function (DUF1549)/Protein of unknown function (DUF1553)